MHLASVLQQCNPTIILSQGPETLLLPWSAINVRISSITSLVCCQYACLSAFWIFNFIFFVRTSDGGNGNHSVSLPIILLKNKVDQMLPSSYISSLLVSDL